ncbi:MAG: protein-glutamate O-methyltransferase CheR [Armatimonadetes bacterium]|nr:protein-glutamate O-methyltransferase CheR [Armatimonadota bacterium]MDW8028306.1 protein-glutamate O-methyltransferase CheR [Armatimonadota bacterium]
MSVNAFQVQQLSQLLKLDLSAYHSQQLQRLVTAFMQRNGFGNLDELILALRQKAELRQRLLDSLGINVTQFFRDPKMWEILAKEILPNLLRHFKSLRVWSAGCSIGKEPYSIAAVLHELDPDGKHSIIATDIDETALQHAQRAEYWANDLNEIPSDYRPLFKIQNGSLVVPSSLKGMVRFQKLNLLSDPYPQDIHLLVCRNLLIYFRPEVKPPIFHGFAQSLVEGGVLFLGASEVLLNPWSYGFKPLQFGFYLKT